MVAALLIALALPSTAPAAGLTVTIIGDPPATAQVGDLLTAGVQVTNNSGSTVSALTFASDATSVGVTTGVLSPNNGNCGGSLSNGASCSTSVSFVLRGVPGTTNSHLILDVTGSGSTSGQDTTTNVTSTEAVTASLSQTAGSTVLLTDQITYTVLFDNSSDSATTLGGVSLPTPAGTTLASSSGSDVSLAADGTPDGGDADTLPDDQSKFQLTVDVSDSDADGTSIVETPAGQYTISGIVTNRAAPITPVSVTKTVVAAALQISPHTLTDVNGGALQPGDIVDISETVANGGGVSATSVLLTDTLTDLTSPTNFQVDGVACGGSCTTGTGQVTSTLGTVASGGSKTLTFSATAPASPTTPGATSAVSVSFSGGPTGSSPVTDAKSLFFAASAPPGDTQAAETTIVHAPKKKTTKRKARFEFASNEPASRFECKVDKGQFTACASPAKFKVKPGRHTLVVRAIDATGNADQTPASFSWKVKPKPA
jgi:hypothetical protein